MAKKVDPWLDPDFEKIWEAALESADKIADEKDQKIFDWLMNEEKIEVKCECGSDKTYGPDNQLHDDWCPKAKVKQ